MENKQYYTLEGRVKHGPMSAQEVLDRFSRLSAGVEMMVWTSSLPDWRPIRDCLKQLEYVAGSERSGGIKSSRPSLSRMKGWGFTDFGRIMGRLPKVGRMGWIVIVSLTAMSAAGAYYLFLLIVQCLVRC